MNHTLRKPAVMVASFVVLGLPALAAAAPNPSDVVLDFDTMAGVARRSPDRPTRFAAFPAAGCRG